MSNDAGILYDFELPLASIARIIKGKLPPGVTLTKEARQACARAGGIFIMALSGSANEYCRDDSRGTLAARDVFSGLRCLQFEDYVAELEMLLSTRSDEGSKGKKRVLDDSISDTRSEPPSKKSANEDEIENDAASNAETVDTKQSTEI